MKKTWFLFLAIAVAAVAGSCGGGGPKDAEGFPPAETLTADSVAIGEVLDVRSMALCGEYAVIHSPKTSKVIFRYRLPGWEFVDTTFTTGEGPEDVASEFYMQGSNRAGEILWASSGNRHKLTKYRVADAMRRQEAIDIPYDLYIWRGNVYNDSLLYFSRVNYDQGKEFLYAAVLSDTLKKVDSLLCSSKVEVSRQGGGISVWMYNTPMILLQGDRAVLWYYGTENVVTYRIGPAGRLTDQRVVFGDTLTYEKVQTMDFKNLKRDYFQSLLAATGDRLYFLRTQYDRVPDQVPDKDNPRKVIAREVRVYDWAMNPVKKFLLEKLPASQVYLDALHEKIYAYDPDLDFEQVYVYDYKL